MCREKSDVRRTEEVDSMQFFRSAKQIYQKNSSCWGISGPADVDRVLHHREAVLFQCLAKLGRVASFGFGMGRQVEKYE